MGNDKHDMSTPAETASEAPASVSAVSDGAKPIQESASAVSPADAWLADLLNGGPVNVCDIEAAAQAGGMSMRTVERAKKRLGVKADKLDMRSGWRWSLLDEGRHEPIPQEAAQTTTPTPEPPAAAPAGPALWQVAMVRNDYAPANTTRLQLVPVWAVMGRR